MNVHDIYKNNFIIVCNSMKKVLQFLGELDPLIFAILYFISTFMATFLIHFLPIFELSEIPLSV